MVFVCPVWTVDCPLGLHSGRSCVNSLRWRDFTREYNSYSPVNAPFIWSTQIISIRPGQHLVDIADGADRHPYRNGRLGVDHVEIGVPIGVSAPIFRMIKRESDGDRRIDQADLKCRCARRQDDEQRSGNIADLGAELAGRRGSES